MSRASNTDQFKFLISCIRWSNNGKVNFTEVAAECDIVSKGAAAKRYERMMKAHGILKPNETPKGYTGNVKSENFAPTTTHSKKRKTGDFDNDQGAQDDEEIFVGSFKQERELDTEKLQIKEEFDDHQIENSDCDDMVGCTLAEAEIDFQGYGTGSSTFYEPRMASNLYESTNYGFHNPANNFESRSVNNDVYGLQSPHFMDFSAFQSHAQVESRAISASQAECQGNHITISD